MASITKEIIEDMDDKLVQTTLRHCVEELISISRNIEMSESVSDFLDTPKRSTKTLEYMEEYFVNVESMVRQELNKRGIKELPIRRMENDEFDNDFW